MAFSFLFPSVLLSCYHHLKAKLGMYFCPSIFEHFRMVWALINQLLSALLWRRRICDKVHLFLEQCLHKLENHCFKNECKPKYFLYSKISTYNIGMGKPNQDEKNSNCSHCRDEGIEMIYISIVNLTFILQIYIDHKLIIKK